MHFHTRLSDWKKSNEEILKLIDSSKTDLLIATEHDIVNTWFRDSMIELWVPSAYWVEISVQDYTDKKSMHILHYSDKLNEILDPKLTSIRESREYKNQKQVEKLREFWFRITYSDMISYYASRWVNTANLVTYHIAEYLFKFEENKKLASKISGISNIWIYTFYNNFLKRWWNFANIGHFEVWDYEFDIEKIRDYKIQNSIFSLAHPNVTFKQDYEAFEEKIEKLVKFWLDGIEINPIAPKKWFDLINYVQAKYDLILTIGSDCHFKETFDWKHSQLFQTNSELSKKQIAENLERIKDRLGISKTNEKFEMRENFKKWDLAVMIGRMNPPHIGHLRVIRQALRENDKLVIFLGSANVVNEKNPFDFKIRWEFLKAVFADEINSWKLILSYLDDCGDDGDWTANLWEKLKILVPEFAWVLNFYGWDFKEDRAINAIKDHESRLAQENVNYIQVERDHFTLPNGLDISATNLRNALNSKDFELAKKIMDERIAPLVIGKWKNI